MTVRASALAAQALREFLLLSLPAQVTANNLTRAAKLTTPAIGPWTFAASSTFIISLDGATFYTVALTAGSRTATQVASDINGTTGLSGVASVLADGRLRLTSSTTPTGPDTVSMIELAADVTGASLLVGFDPAGEMAVRAPLVTPTNRGVCDGEPLVIEPFAQGRMLVVIGDRGDVGVTSELRREERLATLEVAVLVPMARQDYHQSREEIQAACECILDAISTTSGRQLARSADGDVGFVQCSKLKVSGSTWAMKNDLNFMCDRAQLTITCRVFQRPTL